MKFKPLFFTAILMAVTPILAHAQATKQLPINPGTPILKGDKYVSPSGNHYLFFQNDGNLLVQNKSGGYVWGLDKVVPKELPLRQIARVELRTDGTIGLFDDKNNLRTYFGGAKSNNAMLTVSFTGALQVVSGDRILWSSDGNVAPVIKVGLRKADLSRTDSELKSEPGWDQCWILRDPAIKIFATRNVSGAAINAVGVIYADMTSKLQPGLDPTGNP